MHGLLNPRRAAAAQPGLQRQPWSLLILLSVAQFMVILDATVVNVALPSIARSATGTASSSRRLSLRSWRWSRR